MMNSRKTLLTLMCIFLALFITGYIFMENLMDSVVAIIGLILLILGYLSGFFAFLSGILLSVFYFVTSLPIVSVIYGWIVFTLSRIHYHLFNLIFKKILGRMRWYRDLKFKIKNSNRYRSLSFSIDRFLRKLGLKSPPTMKIFQVKRCKNCDRVIPIDSKFCPYCGKILT
ncbi:MAG TPA: zinc-ribbon domain-containing protein [Candidatus Altiarchaeales archaeon]|nr:zinc-ribbon domain-containing protein [Candidatus Altiarchaeales archaeon]